jgi:hypothetical protein
MKRRAVTLLCDNGGDGGNGRTVQLSLRLARNSHWSVTESGTT